MGGFRIRKAERNLVERQELGRKLQAEISEMRKQSNEFMKLLQDGHIQKEYASRSSKLHKEIKYYEGMLAEQEGLTSADRSNGEDKKGSIMQMEEELIKGGFPKAELLQLRRKFEAERGNTTLVTQKK
jgi:seryl-tRNA synthetase